MPLYEYKCNTCGIFEQWRSMAESSNPAHCPACLEIGRRIFSAPTLLNGSLRPNKKANPEPQLERRSSQEKVGGRPWMLGH
jgi:putative FmdB family regulatory protein